MRLFAFRSGIISAVSIVRSHISFWRWRTLKRVCLKLSTTVSMFLSTLAFTYVYALQGITFFPNPGCSGNVQSVVAIISSNCTAGVSCRSVENMPTSFKVVCSNDANEFVKGAFKGAKFAKSAIYSDAACSKILGYSGASVDGQCVNKIKSTILNDDTLTMTLYTGLNCTGKSTRKVTTPSQFGNCLKMGVSYYKLNIENSQNSDSKSSSSAPSLPWLTIAAVLGQFLAHSLYSFYISSIFQTSKKCQIK